MRRLSWLGAWAGLAGIVAGGGGRDLGDDADVLAAVDAWITAFDARDPARIAARYAPDAVLWGTVSETIRTTPDEVLAYFAASVKNRPRVRMQMGERHVRMLGDAACVSGFYTAIDPAGAGDVVMPLRFTFVLAKRAGAWMIVTHHSSRMP
jgi:uncharacterized protein (TIGR02246 family)